MLHIIGGGSPQFLKKSQSICSFNSLVVCIWCGFLWRRWFNLFSSNAIGVYPSVLFWNLKNKKRADTLRHCSLSIHITNRRSKFGDYNTSIKLKNLIGSKMLSFVHFPSNVMIWKYTKINYESYENQNTLPCRAIILF